MASEVLHLRFVNVGGLSNLEPKIKTVKYITLVAALVSGLGLTAKADLVLSAGDIPAIPDSGATVMLLGGALVGLGLLGRYLKR